MREFRTRSVGISTYDRDVGEIALDIDAEIARFGQNYDITAVQVVQTPHGMILVMSYFDDI